MTNEVMAKAVAAMFDGGKDVVPCQVVTAGGGQFGGTLRKHPTVDGAYIMKALMEKAGSREKDMIDVLISGESVIFVLIPDDSKIIVPQGPTLVR